MCYSCDPQLPGKKQERETTLCEDLKDRCTTRYVSYIFTMREKQSDIVFTHYDDTAAVLYFKTGFSYLSLCMISFLAMLLNY